MHLGARPPRTPMPTADDRTFAARLQAALPRLRAFLQRLCDDADDVDDVLQETLTKVWRLRHGYDPQRDAVAWLQRAAFRTFCDHRRRTSRRPDAGGSAVDDEPAPATACPTELRDELRTRLAALPPIERALLIGFHVDGASLQDLATRHDLPVNTVKSHLHRARRRLPRPDADR